MTVVKACLYVTSNCNVTVKVSVKYIVLGSVYVKRQRQHCDDSAMTLMILFSMKTMKSLENGLQPQSGATPLFSMRTVSLASWQSCRSIDIAAWCKQTFSGNGNFDGQNRDGRSNVTCKQDLILYSRIPPQWPFTIYHSTVISTKPTVHLLYSGHPSQRTQRKLCALRH